MKEYHKINSVFKRDPNNSFKTFIMGDYSQPEFETLANAKWIGTEKIDGTNIRINWDGKKVIFGGRTLKAQIPAVLFAYLMAHFTEERMTSQMQGPVTLYGEGYGGKIQKGSGYQVEQRFILFDVSAPGDQNDIWLKQDSVYEISKNLSIPMAPKIFEGSLDEAVSICQSGFKSTVAEDSTKEAEGLVLRPSAELLDRLGKRIVTKVKCKDFTS